MWGAKLQTTSRKEYPSYAVVIIKDSQATLRVVALIKSSGIKKIKGKNDNTDISQKTYSIVAKT